MPRRRPVSNDQLDNAEVLMLPTPRPGGHRGEHRLDAYESPVGAVPVIRQEPLQRKLTKKEEQERRALAKSERFLAERYVRYIDALAEFFGDQEQALAEVFGLSPEEVRPQRIDLLAEVHKGRAVSHLGDILEFNDITLAARAALLRKHAYSANPAASLKAIDMITDLEGERVDTGSFESYIRLLKSQGK